MMTENKSLRRTTVAALALLMPLVAAPSWAQDAVKVTDSNQTLYGATPAVDGGIDFVVYAPEATGVDLLLFATAADRTPSQIIPMRRGGDDWRIRIAGQGVGPGLMYMYRADGARHAAANRPFGAMFNANLPVNDPYARLTQNTAYSAFFASTPFADLSAPVYAGGGKSIVPEDTSATAPGHVVVKPEDLILYELHVQDFTARLDALGTAKGRYGGLARSGLKTPAGQPAGLDHLADLGVTAVELMPIMEYDEESGNAAGRYNHWGYMTANFFAPEIRYSNDAAKAPAEVKEMVKALHDRGIAVVMDVVYNHTAEGTWTDTGRLAAKCFNVLCLSAPQFYRPYGADDRYYANNTGTGNDVSFTGSDRYTKTLVRDSLAYWYDHYGIDGFRFDLARILGDGSDDAALWVSNDTRFAAAHLHAEPWDMGGQWWAFMDSGAHNATNNRWAKWLGKYRDNMRQFSQSGLKNKSLFKQLVEGRGADADGKPASSRPWRSINFISVHDGYTMRDCTWFNDSDGSQNCWDSQQDENLRRERSKLLMGVLMTSQGVPLILQGDEFGATKASAPQDGARNSYNYESAAGDAAIDHVNWIDWGLKDGNTAGSPTGPTYGPELYQWTKSLIAVRKAWSHFRRADFAQYVSDVPRGAGNDGRYTYTWEGPDDGAPTQLAVTWWGKANEPDVMVIYNEHWDGLAVNNLNDWSGGNWKVLARSWYGADAQTCALGTWQTSCPDAGGSIEVKGRSMAILVSDNN